VNYPSGVSGTAGANIECNAFLALYNTSDERKTREEYGQYLDMGLAT